MLVAEIVGSTSLLALVRSEVAYLPMEHLIQKFTLCRSQDPNSQLILGVVGELHSSYSAATQHPELIQVSVEKLSFLPKLGSAICNYVFSQWDAQESPDRWLALGAVAVMKLDIMQDRYIIPDLNRAFPDSAKHCADAIELCIAKFDEIWANVTLEMIQKEMHSSQRARVCLLACLHLLQLARERLPEGTLDHIATWDILGSDFETGLLIGYVLHFGKYQVNHHQFERPHYQKLSWALQMLVDFRAYEEG
jgi:hypothetical protein